MKKFEMDLIFKDDFYQECNSPTLPIPFSMEDMLEISRNNYISRAIIADNLLQMVKEHPERINVYAQLIGHTCLDAGGEAANKDDHLLSNHYFLCAADFAPDSYIVRLNLARSFQHLHSYQEAIINYQYAISVQEFIKPIDWVYYIECLYAIGDIEQVNDLLKVLLEKVEEVGPYSKQAFGIKTMAILSKDNAPEELRALFHDLFLP